MTSEKCELRIHGASERWPDDLFACLPAHWLVVRTLPRQEKKLIIDARRLGLSGCMSYERRIHRYRHKGIYTSLVPLITGYCFLAAGPEHREDVFATERVLNITNVADVSAHEFGHDLANLEKVILAHDGRPQLQPHIQVGDEIEIRCGTFLGCRGVVNRRKGQTSLIVNLRLLERSVSVELPATTAELAELPW
jgi:transcription antitermination factor NusG